MFNIGPMEMLVLLVVGILVVGPDRLPKLTRDASRLLRSLRELTGTAREQVRAELGPELSDLDLQALNPRTALQRLLAEPEPEAETETETQPAAAPASADQAAAALEPGHAPVDVVKHPAYSDVT